MSRPYKPANVPGIMPYLIVKDPESSIAYYSKTFGFKLEGEPLKHEGKIVHAEMTFLDTRIMFGPEGEHEGRTYISPASTNTTCSLGLYLYCTDVDALYHRVKELRANIVQEIKTAFYGDRNFEVVDPDGYRWSFAQNVADFDPSKM